MYAGFDLEVDNVLHLLIIKRFSLNSSLLPEQLAPSWVNLGQISLELYVKVLNLKILRFLSKNSFCFFNLWVDLKAVSMDSLASQWKVFTHFRKRSSHAKDDWIDQKSFLSVLPKCAFILCGASCENDEGSLSSLTRLHGDIGWRVYTWEVEDEDCRGLLYRLLWFFIKFMIWVQKHKRTCF